MCFLTDLYTSPVGSISVNSLHLWGNSRWSSNQWSRDLNLVLTILNPKLLHGSMRLPVWELSMTTGSHSQRRVRPGKGWVNAQCQNPHSCAVILVCLRATYQKTSCSVLILETPQNVAVDDARGHSASQRDPTFPLPSAGLELMTLRLRPKSRVGHSTEWATQGPHPFVAFHVLLYSPLCNYWDLEFTSWPPSFPLIPHILFFFVTFRYYFSLPYLKGLASFY